MQAPPRKQARLISYLSLPCVQDKLGITPVRYEPQRSELYLSHCAGFAMVTDNDIDGRDCTNAGSQVARQSVLKIG